MHMTRAFEVESQTRALWFSLVSCGSLVVVRAACELSVRSQAAETALALRLASFLLPAKISPFDRERGAQRERGMQRQPLLEKDGQVGSVFSVPTAAEILQPRPDRRDAEARSAEADRRDATQAEAERCVREARKGTNAVGTNGDSYICVYIYIYIYIYMYIYIACYM